MSALQVKELRARTGAGFLDCKKALEATNFDIEAAITWLLDKGSAKAAKKAGAIAADGVVAIARNGNKAVIYEVNSQTDFVAQNTQFKTLVKSIGDALINASFSTAEEANAILVDGITIAEACIKATSTIGEKIALRRAELFTVNESQSLGTYVHVNNRIAAVVLTEGGNDEAARNVAMHVASMNPQYLDETQVPADKLAEIKAEVMASDAIASKPEAIREKIAAGMLRKHLSEMTLVDQEFVMEKMPVSKYLSNQGAKASNMVRYEVGEGIEKKEENFAEEVKAQMAG